MSIRLQRFVLGGGLACLLAGATVPAWGQGQRPASTAPNLPPGVAPALRGTNQPPHRRDGLIELEESIRRVFKNIIPSSLEPMPPQRFPDPVVRTAPAKRDADKKDDWLKLDRDRAPAEKSPRREDVFRSRDRDSQLGKQGEQPKTRNALDQFYEDLNRRNQGKKEGEGFFSDRSADSWTKDRDSDSTGDDSSQSGNARDSQTRFPSLNDSGFGSLFEKPAQSGGFADLYGLGKTSPDRTAVPQADNYLKEYRELLGAPPIAEARTPNPTFPGSTLPSARSGLDTMSLYSTAPKPATAPLGGQMVLANPNRSLPTAPTVNSGVLNQWNPMYTPPSPLDSQPARKLMTPPSVLDNTRRRF